MVDLIRYIVDRLQSRIGISSIFNPQGFQFGFVAYADSARTVLEQSGDYGTISLVVDNLLANRNSGGIGTGTDTAVGIDQGSLVVTNNELKQEGSDTKMILLTDAGVGIGVSDAANNYKNALFNGYENRLVVVGLNTNESQNNDLRSLASSPEEFFSSTFQELEDIAEDILEQVCSQELTPTPTRTPTPTPTPTLSSIPEAPFQYSFNRGYTNTYSPELGTAYSYGFTPLPTNVNSDRYWNAGGVDIGFNTYPSPNWVLLPYDQNNTKKYYNNSFIGLSRVLKIPTQPNLGFYTAGWYFSFFTTTLSAQGNDYITGNYSFTLTNTSNNQSATFNNISFTNQGFLFPSSLQIINNTNFIIDDNLNFDYTDENIYKLQITNTISNLEGILGEGTGYIPTWYIKPEFNII